MVQTSYGCRVKCVWFPKEIVILVVAIAFVSIPNGRLFHAVTVAATATNDPNRDKNNANIPNKNNRRYNYNAGAADELYTPYNPLWREEQIYTGERRGSVTTSDNDDDDNSSLRRPRRTGGKSPPAHSPLAPHMSIERYRPQQQQQQPRQTSNSEFPLQSADIGSTESRSNTFRSRFNQRLPFSAERGKRRWSFPIDFRRQKGRLNIGFSTAADPKKEFQHRPPRRLEVGTANAGLLTTATNTTVSTRNRREKVELAIQKMLNPTAAVTTTSPRQYSSSRTGNKHQKKNDLQLSVSLDPFTLVTLLQTGVTGIVGIASVYIGTLKLLGPMLLAKQCLMMVTNTFNYGSKGRRYVRKASTRRIRNLEQQSYLDKHNDATAAARAATRSVLQILCMSFTGRFIGFVLDQTPCLLRPFWICQWWYGVVWLASMYAIGLVSQEWVFGRLAQTKSKMHSFVSIQPTSKPMCLSYRRDNRVNVRHRRRRNNNMIQPLFRFLQKMSQDPEEWMNNLLRIVPRWKGRSNYARSILMSEGEGVNNIELDPLLFPSTWKPLSVVTFLALSRAIYQSFCTNVSSSGLVHKLGDAACMGNSQYLIMRSFIIQKTLYSEWHRVFVQEQRVALGAGVSVIGLLALMWSIYSISTVDRIATIAMVPVLMARMVSTWINILLTYNESGMSADTMTWRDMASHLNGGNDWS